MSTTTTSPDAQTPATPSRAMTMRWPWRLAVIVAAILLFFANLEVWAYRNIATTSAFVDTASDALAQDDVREALATRIVDRLLEGRPLLQITASNTLESVVAGLLGSDGFDAVLRDVATQFHSALTKGTQPSITIESRTLQLVIVSVLQAVDPDELQNVNIQDGTLTIELFTNKDIPSYEQEIRILRWAGIIAGIVGILLLALPALVRRDRWSIRLAGFALLGTTIASFILMATNQWLIHSQVDNEQARVILAGMFARFARALVVQTGIIMLISIVLILIGFAVWPFSRGEAKDPEVASATAPAPA